MNFKLKKLLSILAVATFILPYSVPPSNVVHADNVQLNGVKDEECTTVPINDGSDDSSDGSETPSDVLQREIYVYSAYHQYGFSDALIAGILSAWDTESGITAKRFETEPLGKVSWKEAEQANFDPTAMYGSWGAFQALYPNMSLNERGYIASDGKHYVGIGLGQWTGNRALSLLNTAKKVGVNVGNLELQLTYSLTNDSGAGTLLGLAKKGYSDPVKAAEDFTILWEGVPSQAAIHAKKADAIYADIKSGKIKSDSKYASKIKGLVDKAGGINSGDSGDISGGQDNSATDNSSDSSTLPNCTPSEDSSSNIEDGTGDDSDLLPKYTKPVMGDNIPEELKKYIKYDPQKYGMSYNANPPSGWKADYWVGQSPAGQCTEFAESFTACLYGILDTAAGNGQDVASSYAKKFGGKTTDKPSATAIGSVKAGAENTGDAGHVYIVEHVFSNGDILIVEQNFAGASGQSGGKPYTWNYRIIEKSVYSGHTDFYKSTETLNKPK